MATPRVLTVRLGLVAALSCMLACATTDLSVRVFPPKGASKAGFYAGVGPVGELCIPIGRRETTDDAGVIQVSERWCDDMQLVVAAPGYETHRSVIDTCKTRFAQVEMHKAKALAIPVDDCALAAMRVMQIWLSRNADALRDELVDPNDLQLYLRENDYAPWQISYEPGVLHGDECSVTTSMYYDVGCVGSKRIDLLRVGDRWRLRGLQDPH